jgi:hypothetical protein
MEARGVESLSLSLYFQTFCMRFVPVRDLESGKRVELMHSDDTEKVSRQR